MGVNLPVYPLKGHLVSASPAPGQPMVTRNIYRYIYETTVISTLSTVISTVISTRSPRHGLLSPLAPRTLRLSGGVQAVGQVRTNHSAASGHVTADLTSDWSGRDGGPGRGGDPRGQGAAALTRLVTQLIMSACLQDVQ